jgi:hypothetical protein
MDSMEIATWIIAISTSVYTIFVIVTAYYIADQLKENQLLRQATVLKEAYDYVIRTHKFRKIVYNNKNEIKKVQTIEDLQNFENNRPEVNEAMHEVANCYHYIGFLMKSGLLTNKVEFFEEGGNTFLRVYEIISPVIQQERARTDETYKQYLEYLKEEMEKITK